MKLSELTTGLVGVFTSQHMSEKTLHKYQLQWNHLEAFLTDAYGDDNFDYERGMAYFQKKFGLLPNAVLGELAPGQQRVLRVINTLEEFQLTGGVANMHYSRKTPPVLTRKFAAFLTEYETEYLREALSKSRNQFLRRICQNLLLHLQQIGVEDLSAVNMPALESFMKTWASYSARTVNNNLGALRHLLRYMHSRKIIDTDLSEKLHARKLFQDSSIPSGWTDQEIQILLDSIDRNNPMGKRDYAMILLACVLGIRAGDIAGLKFSNLDLRSKRISLIQHKTQRPLDLPIPKEVGWPLIDYIKNGRPEFVKSDFVFVRHTAPFTPFSRGNALSAMLDNRCRKAGIKKSNMHRGFHSLRHAAANGYLEMETPLPVITEILGHANMRTTSIYLKRDLKKLAECVLNPEEPTDGKA
ncbi:MAG: tyrosine-type recombinase/integrase [Burkholderiales bacterium]|nr:tyrosine-type recombinase/integrase [Burkholderiales bacterium]